MGNIPPSDIAFMFHSFNLVSKLFPFADINSQTETKAEELQKRVSELESKPRSISCYSIAIASTSHANSIILG